MVHFRARVSLFLQPIWTSAIFLTTNNNRPLSMYPWITVVTVGYTKIILIKRKQDKYMDVVNGQEKHLKKREKYLPLIAD